MAQRRAPGHGQGNGRGQGKPQGQRPGRFSNDNRRPAGKPFTGRPTIGKPTGVDARANRGAGADRRGADPTTHGVDRLQKVLAHAGIGSRRACEELILQGRVSVDGKIIRELGTKIDPQAATIEVDGQRIARERHVYYAVHKPRGHVSTNHDPGGRPRVVDLLPEIPERVYTIGRLDENSVGLMLLTNDGELANRLSHPKFGVEKIYRLVVAGTPGPEILRKLTEGVWLAEGKVRARRVRLVGRKGEASVLEMVLAEGKNREVRRMLAQLGHKVMALTRISVGPISLKGISSGEARKLTSKEVDLLRRAAAGEDLGPARNLIKKRPSVGTRKEVNRPSDQRPTASTQRGPASSPRKEVNKPANQRPRQDTKRSASQEPTRPPIKGPIGPTNQRPARPPTEGPIRPPIQAPAQPPLEGPTRQPAPTPPPIQEPVRSTDQEQTRPTVHGRDRIRARPVEALGEGPPGKPAADQPPAREPAHAAKGAPAKPARDTQGSPKRPTQTPAGRPATRPAAQTPTDGPPPRKPSERKPRVAREGKEDRVTILPVVAFPGTQPTRRRTDAADSDLGQIVDPTLETGPMPGPASKQPASGGRKRRIIGLNLPATESGEAQASGKPSGAPKRSFRKGAGLIPKPAFKPRRKPKGRNHD